MNQLSLGPELGRTVLETCHPLGGVGMRSSHWKWVVLIGMALGLAIFASSRRMSREGRPDREELPPSQPIAGGPWIEIPGGRFGSGSEGVEIEVRPFLIGRTEVTNGEFAAFVAACPEHSDCGPTGLPNYWHDEDYLARHADLPIVNVTWGDARAFCRWKGARLPDIFEWEKAARGTDGREYPTGGIPDSTVANLVAHSERSRTEREIPTWPVTDPRYQHDHSPYGALGMAGNVSEWTSSRSENEPDRHLAAGGSWESYSFSEALAYHRLPQRLTERSASLGFRCAKSN